MLDLSKIFIVAPKFVDSHYGILMCAPGILCISKSRYETCI
jgi:hypothetical protein